MRPTAGRNLANRLAPDQPERALSIAQAIEAPWFRCQALSHVARYWPDEKYSRILEEAVRAADVQDEIYKRVAVSAWPIRAYLERKNIEPARSLLSKYARSARSIVNMGSRSEALLLIFQAARPFAPDLWQPVFRALIDAGEPSLSWRQGRAIRYAADMVICDDRQLIEEATRILSDRKHLSTLQALLVKENAQQEPPRPFFWIENETE